MSIFKPVKIRNLDDHFKEILPFVKSHFRHVTKPLVDIPGFTETYLEWRSYIRRIKGDNLRKSVHDRIKEDYLKKYPNYDFPNHILNPLIDYSIYRYFIQTPELRPQEGIDFASDVINPVQKNKDYLLSEFANEVERKKLIAIKEVSKSLKTSDISALRENRPNYTISKFLVGKSKKTQKKTKGKKRRRTESNRRKK